MVSRSVLITLCILLLASVSFGQGFSVAFYSIEEPLTDACVGGNPLPNGTTVLIFHDPTFNGPSADDFQPTVGTADNNVNYNSFEINGAGVEGVGPGNFYNNPQWISYGGVPTPSFFYLLVCYNNIHYYSSSFFLGAGAASISFGPTQQYSWTCVDAPCEGICLPPARPTDLAATTTLCDRIDLTWNHNAIDIIGFEINRGGEFLAEVMTTTAPFTYSDFTAPNGNSTYRVAAIRTCPDQTEITSQLSDPSTGTRLPAPPIPNLVSTSTTYCDSVVSMVSVASVSGLNEVRLYRVETGGDVLVATKTNPTAGVQFRMKDIAPLIGPQEYYAVGWSTTCGEGTQSTHRNGEAFLRPQGTVTITEVEGTCEAVHLTWTYSGDDDVTEFIIKRNTTRFDSVDANTSEYFDVLAVPGVQTGYRVIPKNACGDGTPSSPVIGTRLDTPNAVTGVSTVSMCNCIRVNWTDLAGDIISYGIYRNNVLVDTEDPGVGFYEDCDETLVFGTNYSYYVAATNECGEGDHSATVSGTLAQPNAGTATLALVSAGPPDWDYSLTWTTGCVSRLTIRSLCDGTTADYVGTGDWDYTLYDEGDSVVFWTDTTPLDEDQGTLTGFRLSNSTGCSGSGTWTAGTQDGSIEGPLPIMAGRELPTEYSLAVYPNPFNPTTNLEFALPQATFLNVSVFDVTGRLVSQLLNGTFDAGYHNVSFDASNLPSGLYFARVHSNEFATTKKLMLLK
ncbi:T9SS type A sorting domain-containing protein [bacterium]|nr:T9SS type A sorting domain-containing protein [bacterium]